MGFSFDVAAISLAKKSKQLVAKAPPVAYTNDAETTPEFLLAVESVGILSTS